MVVVLDESPYANVELVLMQFYGEALDLPTDTVVLEDKVNGLQINRMTGEPDDGLTDYPRVRIISYHDDYAEAERMAERVRQVTQRIDNGRQPVVMAPDADPDLAGKTILFDTARGDVPPENEAYPNPDRVQVVSYYRYALRRPR